MTASDFDYLSPAPTPPSSGVTWGVKDLVIGTVLVVLLYAILGTIIVYPVAAHYGDTSAQSLVAQAATVMLWDAGMVSIVFWIVRSKGGSWSNLGLHLPNIGGLARVGASSPPLI